MFVYEKFTFVSFRGIPLIHSYIDLKVSKIRYAPYDYDNSFNLRSIFSWFLRPPKLGSGALRLNQTQSRQHSLHILFSFIQQHFHYKQEYSSLCGTLQDFNHFFILSNKPIREVNVNCIYVYFGPNKMHLDRKTLTLNSQFESASDIQKCVRNQQNLLKCNIMKPFKELCSRAQKDSKNYRWANLNLLHLIRFR